MRNGFTLVELSIVIVVIGLLAAGIISGRSLLESTYKNTVLVSFKKIEEGYDKFKIKYEAFPGDISDATKYWPAANNGNGDNSIGYNGMCCHSGGIDLEPLWFWQDLNYSGLLDGFTSDGIFPGGAGSYRIGGNVPGGPYANSFYEVYTSWNGDGTMASQALLQLSTHSANKNGSGYAIVPSADAEFLDKKIDDGAPMKGRVVITIGAGSSWSLAESNCYTVAGGQQLYSDKGNCALYYSLEGKVNW